MLRRRDTTDRLICLFDASVCVYGIVACTVTETKHQHREEISGRKRCKVALSYHVLPDPLAFQESNHSTITPGYEDYCVIPSSGGWYL